MRMKGENENSFDFQIRSILGDATEEVPEKVWAGIERRLPAVQEGSGKTVVLPLWTKLAAGFAAAAAVAAIMFLTGTFDRTAPQGGYDRLAESGTEEEINIVVPEKTDESAGEEAAPGSLEQATEPSVEDKASGITAGEAVRSAATGLLADAQEYRTGDDSMNDSVSTGKEEAGNAPESEEVTGEAGEAVSAEETGEAGTPEAGAPAGQSGQEDMDKAAGEEENPDPDDAARWEQMLREEESRGAHTVRTSLTLSGNAISNTNSSVSMDAAMPSYRPGKTELTEDRISEASESSYSVPVSFGVGVKIDFAKRWAVSAGVNYSLLGRSFAGTFFDVQEDGSYTENYFSDIRNRQDYIGIPVNVYFSILRSNIIDFYAYAGGTAEKCVSDRYLMKADGFDINHREKVEGMQFSVNAGLGMEFIIADTFGIYIDPSLRYYFPDSRQPRSIRTSQPLMFGLELGFRVHL